MRTFAAAVILLLASIPCLAGEPAADIDLSENRLVCIQATVLVKGLSNLVVYSAEVRAFTPGVHALTTCSCRSHNHHPSTPQQSIRVTA
jgi:hypothetical protein